MQQCKFPAGLDPNVFNHFKNEPAVERYKIHE